MYIGQAGIGDKSCIGDRLKSHTKDDLAGRWDMFSWFGFCQVRKDKKLGARFNGMSASWQQVANILEGVLIEIAEPPQNSQKGRFGPNVRRYLQYVPRDNGAYSPKKDIENLKKSVLAIKKMLKNRKK